MTVGLPADLAATFADDEEEEVEDEEAVGAIEEITGLTATGGIANSGLAN